MSTLINKVRQKQAFLLQGDIERGKRSNYREAFQNEDGAIDLASIMVGIIVIGLIGGVIAATVFAVIPWSQDNAAKHQLDSIVAAQSAYMGLSSDSPPALPSGHKANSFADSALLADANLLQMGSTYCAVITDDGKGYQGLAQSSSGKVWSVLDSNTKPADLGQGSIAPDCSFIAGGVPDGEDSETGGNESVPYVDPTPTKTIMTYKCDSSNYGTIPIKDKVTGSLSVNGELIATYANAVNVSQLLTFEPNVEYKVVFDGTYETFSSYTTHDTKLGECLRAVDHWGSDTGVKSANLAFRYAGKLTHLPEHIPNSVTTMNNMFVGAALIDSPNISKWDVSSVTNMGSMFSGTNFNQPLNDWNVGNVTDMKGMFSSTTSFDQPLNDWNVSNVEHMSSMFAGSKKFNQALDQWKMPRVSDMSSMFAGATNFNQPLNAWDVSSVTNMDSMFKGATKFDQPLNNWDVSGVGDMGYMFYNSKAFYQDLSKWNVKAGMSRGYFATGSLLAGNPNYMPVWK